MNTKILPEKALSVIDQYMNFSFGRATCSVPYFNNKTVGARMALRVNIGKGSPKEIYEEVQALIVKNHIDSGILDNDSLKRLMADNNIGVDCSAFTYYVLDAISRDSLHGGIDRHLSFVNCGGIFGKFKCSIRPVENCDVATFTHDKNSHPINISDARCGDFISMVNDGDDSERDHIIIIHQIEYQNFIPIKIHYSHAIKYLEDGLYGSGIRQGTITIVNQGAPLTEAIWEEDGKNKDTNLLFLRAKKSQTSLRRLNWFK